MRLVMSPRVFITTNALLLLPVKGTAAGGVVNRHHFAHSDRNSSITPDCHKLTLHVTGFLVCVTIAN